MPEKSGTPAGPTIWFDVEDFLEHFDWKPKAAGIQRVQMEIFARLPTHGGSTQRVRFCRLNRFSHQFEAIDYPTIERTFRDPPMTYAERAVVPERPPMFRRVVSEPAWIRDFWALLRRYGRGVPGKLRPGDARLHRRSFAPLNRGDTLVCTGTAWMNRRYGVLIAEAKRELDLRFVVLINDIIPVTHPQYFEADAVAKFRHWLAAMLRCADHIVTVSDYSRRSLLAYATERRQTLPEITVLKLGATFDTVSTPAARQPPHAGFPRPYVLFVSTIEIRKNHRLLVNVWRRLIERHGTAAPYLVFVGTRGWLVDPLMAELRANQYLGGKVRLLSGLSDAELRLAYRYCLFTVYPSFVEGWGLPPAESLSHGKLCVASNRSSIPEVGGELADYIDPEDEVGALAAIERAIFDDAYRQAREARIRAAYRAPSWSACADALMAASLRTRGVGGTEYASGTVDPAALPEIVAGAARH